MYIFADLAVFICNFPQNGPDLKGQFTHQTYGLNSRFSPDMPVGPVLFKSVSCISIIFGSNVSKILAIDPIVMTIDPKMMMIDLKMMIFDPNMMTIDLNVMMINLDMMTIDPT